LMAKIRPAIPPPITRKSDITLELFFIKFRRLIYPLMTLGEWPIHSQVAPAWRLGERAVNSILRALPRPNQFARHRRIAYSSNRTGDGPVGVNSGFDA